MQDTNSPDTHSQRTSVHSNAAALVLTNATLVRHATSFQGGLPKDLYDFARRCFPEDWDAIPASDRRQRVCLLGVEVIRRGHLALLQLAACVLFHEPVGRQLVARRIPLPIQHTIENHRPDMLRWIYTNGYDPYARPEDMWNDAIAHFHGDFSVLEELNSLLNCASEPVGVVEIQPSVVFRLMDIDLLRWIHANLANAKIPVVRVMNEAVQTGRIEVVRFLHESYPEPTFRSDMYIRALTRDTHEVLEFLLKHRPEPYNDRFVEQIVSSGRLRVLEMVHHHRGLRLEPRILELLRSNSDDAVKSFLAERVGGSSKCHALRAYP